MHDSEFNCSHSQWLEQVFQQQEGRLVRYATRLLGDVERARDVAQDTFLKLCCQDRQQMDGKVVPWLLTVCRNRALDIRKKESRMKTINQQQVDQCTTGQANQAEAVEQQEVIGQATRLLARLPERQQEVIRLKLQEGLSYREISDVTGLSVSNVGFLLHKGIRSLRQQFAQ